MTKAFVLFVFLAGCAVQPPAALVDMSVLDCRDPETRRRLGAGDTYRDLARAHADAVAGWQDCKSAAASAQAVIQGAK